tara:strand:- start:2131 stop:2634 length:504 start_codon:yes stop_codon:yes gene_type:complete
MRSNLCDLGVAACVIHDGRILLVQEAEGSHEGLWGLPKGFVEEGESPSAAAIRELEEECGITGEILGIIGMRECVRNGQTAVFLSYLIRPLSLDVSLNNKEIMNFGWYSIENFESIDWISSTMQSLALTSLAPNQIMKIFDISEQIGYPYSVYLMTNNEKILTEVSI